MGPAITKDEEAGEGSGSSPLEAAEPTPWVGDPAREEGERWGSPRRRLGRALVVAGAVTLGVGLLLGSVRVWQAIPPGRASLVTAAVLAVVVALALVGLGIMGHRERRVAGAADLDATGLPKNLDDRSAPHALDDHPGEWLGLLAQPPEADMGDGWAGSSSPPPDSDDGDHAPEAPFDHLDAAPSSVVVDYRPVADLDTMEVVGVEALPRWIEAVAGLGPDGDRPELAGPSGRQGEMLEATLLAACRDLATGAAEARGWWVAVKVSQDDCADPTLPSRVSGVLAETGLDPARLMLEIPERAVPEPAAQRSMRHLAQMGVTVALDDFGSGWSSLGQLRAVPVGVLKLDRSLVTRPSPAKAQLAVAVTALADLLGVETVAAGVDDEEDLRLARVAACDYAQGSWWSEPDSLDAILERFPPSSPAALPVGRRPLGASVAHVAADRAPTHELPASQGREQRRHDPLVAARLDEAEAGVAAAEARAARVLDEARRGVGGAHRGPWHEAGAHVTRILEAAEAEAEALVEMAEAIAAQVRHDLQAETAETRADAERHAADLRAKAEEFVEACLASTEVQLTQAEEALTAAREEAHRIESEADVRAVQTLTRAEDEVRSHVEEQLTRAHAELDRIRGAELEARARLESVQADLGRCLASVADVAPPAIDDPASFLGCLTEARDLDGSVGGDDRDTALPAVDPPPPLA